MTDDLLEKHCGNIYGRKILGGKVMYSSPYYYGGLIKGGSF